MLFRLTDSVTGLAKSGLDVTTLKLQYERPGEAVGTATSLTLLAALTTAWTSYGARECDATNSKGVYRVDPPNAAFATGADEVTLSVSGAGIETATRLVDLTGADMRNATNLGLTNIDATIGSRLAPTVAGRTLDVSTGGEAGIDWANVGTPGSTVALSATTFSTTQAITSVSGAVGSVTGAVGSVTGNVGGNVTGSVGSVTGAVGSVTGSVGSVTGSVGSVTGNVGGNVVGSTASVTAAVTVGAMNAAGLATLFTVNSTKTYADAVAGSPVLEIATNAGAGGGSTDWTTTERGQIRYRLGLDGTPATPSATPTLPVTSVAGNVGGNVVGSVASVTGAVGSVTGSVGSVTGAVGSVTGNVGGNVTGSVGSVVGAVASVTAPVAITSALKKNQALAGFTFVMTDSTTHLPTAGLTVTATRSLDGAAFAACANAPAGIASGAYKIDLAAGDLNANTVTLRFTATGADDLLVTLVTQP